MIVLSARSDGPSRSRIATTPESKVSDSKLEEEGSQQHQPAEAGLRRISSEPEDDNERPKRPHVPYSQREIYEKKNLALSRRPPVRPSSSRRSTACSSDGGSTPIYQDAPISSPSYSNSRTISSPAISTPPASCGGANTGRHSGAAPVRGSSTDGGGTRRAAKNPSRASSAGGGPGRQGPGNTPKHGSSAGGGAGANRRPTITPTHDSSTGTVVTPSCTYSDRMIHEGTAESAHQPRSTNPSQLTPINQPHHQSQASQLQHAQFPAQTPNSSRSRDPASPAFGPRHPSPTATVADDTTPTSARPGRTPGSSANRPMPLPHSHSQPRPQTAKPSPGKATPCSFQAGSSPQGARAAPNSPAKATTARATSPLPVWNSSTSRASTPGGTPNRPTGSATRRPPRKPVDSLGGSSSDSRGGAGATGKLGCALEAAVDKHSGAGQERVVAVGKGPGSGYGRDSPASATKCMASRNGVTGNSAKAGKSSTAIRMRGGMGAGDSDTAGEAIAYDSGLDAESLGLIDLDTGESGSLCGSKTGHAGVPAKGSLLVPAPSCDEASEGGAGRALAALGEAAARGSAAAAAAGPRAEKKGKEEGLGAKGCNCIVM